VKTRQVVNVRHDRSQIGYVRIELEAVEDWQVFKDEIGEEEGSAGSLRQDG